jgi:DNA-binding response OmpR family regulator
MAYIESLSMKSPQTVLVIDDDQVIRDVLNEFLTEQGYKAVLAADGLEGLDSIKNETYDLIIMDIRLPYVSGIGLVKIARQENPQIPIICITGYGDSPEKIAEEEKADVTLAKPFNLKDLQRHLTELLGK